MAKQFLANRSGQTPTLDEAPNETIKIYPTEAALDADLANLEENEIVATEEDNNPASSTQYPVDVVQDGNMHAVTSNAVADIFSADIDNTKFALSTTANVEVTAQYTGLLYVVIRQDNTSGSTIYENETGLVVNDNYSEGSYYRTFTILIRKGRKYKWAGNSGSIYFQRFIPFNLS
jgi:hypothetical protein